MLNEIYNWVENLNKRIIDGRMVLSSEDIESFYNTVYFYSEYLKISDLPLHVQEILVKKINKWSRVNCKMHWKLNNNKTRFFSTQVKPIEICFGDDANKKFKEVIEILKFRIVHEAASSGYHLAHVTPYGFLVEINTSKDTEQKTLFLFKCHIIENRGNYVIRDFILYDNRSTAPKKYKKITITYNE
jgi:hypothetical protein